MSATEKQIRDLAAAMAAQCQAIAGGTLTGPAYSQAQIILRNAEMLAAWVPDDRSGMPDPAISERLEYLRGELQAERISYGELAELQALAPHIAPGDVELLEAAGVPEFPEYGPQLPEEGSDEYFEWARRAPSMEIPDDEDEDEDEDPGPHEYDGYISLDGSDRPRWGYYVRLEGVDHGGPFPSEAIATYELAKAMAGTGSFPAAWAEGEHGPSVRPIDDEVRAYHDAGGDGLLPLPGVEYEPGDLVANDGWPSRVDGDYGDLGVMVHADGDPSVTALAHHETLTRIEDEN